MAKTRRSTAGLEAQVAMEALREDLDAAGDCSTASAASEPGGPVEARRARGAGRRLRGSPAEGRCTHEKEIRSLYAKIGQLVMDRDSLEAALER